MKGAGPRPEIGCHLNPLGEVKESRSSVADHNRTHSNRLSPRSGTEHGYGARSRSASGGKGDGESAITSGETRKNLTGIGCTEVTT